MKVNHIIEKQARSFYAIATRDNNFLTGSTDFKHNLEIALYDYDESTDKLIFLYQIDKCTTEEYEKHKIKCKSPDKPEKCHESTFHLTNKYFVEQEIRKLNPIFEFKILRPNINADLIKENLVELSNCPEAANCYQSAMDKLNQDRFERNLLDDLRLCIEYLLKYKLKNSKNIENQIRDLGLYLKYHRVTSEIRNVFVKQLDYYMKYQNRNVKHDDNVKEEEVDFIVNMTSSMIKFLNQYK